MKAKFHISDFHGCGSIKQRGSFGKMKGEMSIRNHYTNLRFP